MAPLPRPWRIAVDVRALVPAPTGIGIYTRALLLELRRRGLDLLGLAHRPVHPTVGPELEAAGIPCEHRWAPYGVLWQQVLLPRRLARGDVDLLWSPITTLPLRSPVPGVVTVHDLTTVLLPEVHRTKVRWSVLPFLRPSLEQARAVVCDSRATADDIAFHFPQCRDRLRVVYPGVDAEFRPGEPDRVAALREELGCPQGYLLYAGTIEPRKGLHTLLDAWETLRREDPSTPPLVVAGPYGWRSAPLLRRIESLRSRGLIHLGHLERGRLVEVFQAARLFVYPSLYEGFGLPPAEALACGVPAVVSRAASLPEVVGEAGALFPPEDAPGLAAAIHGVLVDPQREADLRARGPAQAARFSWSQAAAELEDVFAAALG